MVLTKLSSDKIFCPIEELPIVLCLYLNFTKLYEYEKDNFIVRSFYVVYTI